MAKFVQLSDTSGNPITLNTDMIYYLEVSPNQLNKSKLSYKIEVPGRVIWLTEAMYNKVISQII